METEKNKYEKAYEASLDPKAREDFWREHAKNIEWDKFPENILDSDHPPFYKWFKDGMMNMCYNCVDRHLKTQGEKIALIYDSTICNTIQKYTFNQLHDNVSKLGSVFQEKFGI